MRFFQYISGIRAFLLIIICLFAQYISAQNANWNAGLPAIATDGFYKIPLPPQLLSKAGNKLNRIRIFEGNTEVPFLIKKEVLATSKTNFEALPILETGQRDSLGYLIFSSGKALKISKLNLIIKRAWVAKKLKISGSNDGKNWFVVRSQFLLNTLETGENEDETTVRYVVDLPLTDYKYYKIESSNRDELSINILAIGYFLQSAIHGNYASLPDPVVEKVKIIEPNTDLFKLTFKESFIVNRLTFEISKPHFFLRNARLYSANPPVKNLDGKNKISERIPYSVLKLSSKDSVNYVDMEETSTRSLFLLVENQNNPSLEFKTVHAFQYPYYLNTYLEKDKKYKFVIGSDKLKTPVYDLANFDNQINTEIPVLEIRNLKKEELAAKPADEIFFKTKIWIWLGLLFVAGLLAYMSVQMIKEIKK